MIAAVAYVVLIVVLGYAVACLFRPDTEMPVTTQIGTAIVFGAALAGILLFLLSCIGILPRVGAIVLAIAAVLCGSIVAIRKSYFRQPDRNPDPKATLLLLLPITFALALIMVHAFGHVNYEWDAYMNWDIKARVLTHSAITETNFFRDLNFVSIHLGYPLLLPFHLALVNGIAGQNLDIAHKVVFPFLFIGMALLLYGDLSRTLKQWSAIVILGLFVTTPAIIRWSGSGLADVPLAAFYAGWLVFVRRWLHTQNHRNLIVAGVMIAGAAFTKNEGMAIAALGVVAVAVMAISRREYKALTLHTLVILLCVLPWLIYRQGFPQLNENYPGRLSLDTLITNAARLSEIGVGFGKLFLSFSHWHWFWPLLLISVIFGGRALRAPATMVVAGMLLAHTFVYVLVFWIGSQPELAHMIATVGPRLSIQLSVPALLLLADCWASCHRQCAAVTPRGGDTPIRTAEQ